MSETQPQPPPTDEPEMIPVKMLIPKTMLDEFDALHHDPITGRPKYGARSDVVRSLLKQYLLEAKAAKARSVTEIFADTEEGEQAP